MNSEGSVSMTTISEGENELQDEDEGENDGIGCERKNAIVIDGASERALRPQGALLVQPQPKQSHGVNIYWERFLHVTSIKVLLVESDDSTRHIVSALLRNCNYEVIVAANVLQAWKVLEELTNHVDLVLIELEMPDVSGIGLLCKIMSHKTRKNLPVIMMSSCHSMSLVVKCLSKGAVDFLVKPIRKNELKNLWQHVWRRCQSSSGSGSETGAQTQDPDDDDDGGGDDDDGNPEDVRNRRSVLQSFSTKKDVEVDSSQAAFPHNEVPKQSRFKINSKNTESQTVVSVGKNATMYYESRKLAIEPSLKRLKESREASHCMFWHSEKSVFTRYNASSKSDHLGATAHTVQDDKTNEKTFATNGLQAKAVKAQQDPCISHHHHCNRNIHRLHSQEPEPAMNDDRMRTSVPRDDSGCGSGKRMDPDKLAKRRAALTKLLQKKKKKKKTDKDFSRAK